METAFSIENEYSCFTTTSAMQYGQYNTAHTAQAISAQNFENLRITAEEEQAQLARQLARTGRPGGGSIGTVTEESPIGDIVLPMLLCVVIYTIHRAIKQYRTLWK